jgi:hypothetical protein
VKEYKLKKTMHSVEVEADELDQIVITQRWNDINENDPVISISKEQAPLLAQWILEAAEAGYGESEGEERIPVKYWAHGPEVSEQMEVFCNGSGMVVLRLNDDAFIEISPIMAKRLREQLSRAITGSLTNMFRPDSEI